MSPYELNITYFDAFGGINGSQSLQEKRFICSQIISFSLKGVPGIYFHNFTASRNNMQGVAVTGKYRTINRKKWDYDELTSELNDPDTTTHRIFNKMKQIIECRKKHPAFHPFGRQKAFDVDDDLLCLLRWDPEKTEEVLVIANVTNKEKVVDASAKNLPIKKSKGYSDIISGKKFFNNGRTSLQPYEVIWIKVSTD